jgi:phosphate transport system substrate-binding protein
MKMKILSAAMLVSALALAPLGCKSNPASSDGGAMNLTGAGGTFPNPIYQRWFTEYSAAHAGVHINYQSVGSGAGIRQVSQGIVDFGASDGPMSDKQLAAAKGKIIHIPTVLGAVVPAYTLPGVTQELHFAPDVIADIYLGHITKWNDPRLVKDNPGVNLPNHAILPVYRSDGSGTNYIFTDFLSKSSDEFKQKIGSATSVQWPNGVGQKGNEGVAGMIRNSPYAFGYVELIYASQNHMLYGSVKNPAGNWVKASTDTVSAAAAGAADNMPADYRVSITNAPGANSYPIASFTWLLIPVPFDSPAKGKVMHDFLGWMLDQGESEASSMTYAPLPSAVAARVRQTIQEVQ